MNTPLISGPNAVFLAGLLFTILAGIAAACLILCKPDDEACKPDEGKDFVGKDFLDGPM